MKYVSGFEKTDLIAQFFLFFEFVNLLKPIPEGESEMIFFFNLKNCTFSYRYTEAWEEIFLLEAKYSWRNNI